MSQTNPDYDGRPVPRVKLEDFSKSQLVDLLNLYSRLFFAMDGFWYLALMESFDTATATEIDLQVWERYARYEARRLLPLMNIPNDDLSHFPTAFGLSPWFSNLDYSFVQKGPSELVLTVLECPSLEAMKREGTGREQTFCSQVEPQLLQMIVKSFHPQARVSPVELPLKQTRDDICCRWRFTLPE